MSIYQPSDPVASLSVIVYAQEHRNLEWRADAERCFAGIASGGFKQVEVLMGTEPVDMTFGELRRIIAKNGLNVKSVHTRRRKLHPDYIALGCPDKDTFANGIERFIRYVYFAQELEADYLVVHTAPLLHQVAVDHPLIDQRIRGWVERSLDALMPHLERADMQLLLENGWNGLPYSRPQQICDVIEPYPPQYVGLVLDTDYPADWHEQPQDTIREIGTRLCGVHLSDMTDGIKHTVPGTGNMDWDAIRAALAEVNYTGTWTFEVAGNDDPDATIKQTRAVATSWGLT